MTRPTAAQIIDELGLEPNHTCGWVRVTYANELEVSDLPAPFGGTRPLGTALYFLVEPEAPVLLHRIRNDQLYHYYLGDPLELTMHREDGTTEQHIVGPDLLAGQVVQLRIPGGTFHSAHVIAGGSWFLGGSTEWPGVVPDDVELGATTSIQP